jgi:hypothetical protein
MGNPNAKAASDIGAPLWTAERLERALGRAIAD